MKSSYKPALLILMLLTVGVSQSPAQKSARSVYEIRKYQITGPEQEKRLDVYLQHAYIPAVRKAGIRHVGVFKPVLSDTLHAGKYVYVFTPFTSLAQFEKLPAVLQNDKAYLEAGKDYINAAYNNPPYIRYETTLLRAFTDAPLYRKPNLITPLSKRVYELRSYEGHTEKIHLNKVQMFNAGGEIVLFERLGFNAVFYGEVLAGSTQPNLMYMTAFEDMASRNAHWDAFRTDAAWLKLKEDPAYQNNVSKNVQLLLYPADYSDL